MINQAADKIDDYIKTHPDEVLQRKEPFEIAGKRQDLDVIRLPLNLLTYNIQNGRFAAELQELEASEGRFLDPTVERDAAKIEELLLRDSTKAEWLKSDIRRVGQLQPATITYDGFIVNGNRRAAVLKQLFQEAGEQCYAYLEVVRLPTNVSSSDLWRFEAGFQLSTDLKVDYGPVNELLKIKEGREYGLTDQEIAVILGGGNTVRDVKKKMRQLDLIEDYLNYFDQNKRYSLVEKRVEHFIDLDNIMQKKEWRKLDTTQQTIVVQASYLMINLGKLPHLDVRKIGNFLKDPSAALKWAGKTLKVCGIEQKVPVPAEDKKDSFKPLEEHIQELESKLLSTDTDLKTTTSTTIIEQQTLPEQRKIVQPANTATQTSSPMPPEPPQTLSPTSTQQSVKIKEALKEVFQETAEQIDLDQQKKKPGKILQRVENNLLALSEISNDHLRPHSAQFSRIEELVEELALKFG